MPYVISASQEAEILQQMPSDPSQRTDDSIVRIIRQVLERSDMAGLSSELVRRILYQVSDLRKMQTRVSVALVCKSWAQYVSEYPLSLTVRSLPDPSLASEQERERMRRLLANLQELHLEGFHAVPRVFLSRMLQGSDRLTKLTLHGRANYILELQTIIPNLTSLESVHEAMWASHLC